MQNDRNGTEIVKFKTRGFKLYLEHKSIDSSMFQETFSHLILREATNTDLCMQVGVILTSELGPLWG